MMVVLVLPSSCTHSSARQAHNLPHPLPAVVYGSFSPQVALKAPSNNISETSSARASTSNLMAAGAQSANSVGGGVPPGLPRGPPAGH